MKKLLIPIILLFCSTVKAQTDTIHIKLPKVDVSGKVDTSALTAKLAAKVDTSYRDTLHVDKYFNYDSVAKTLHANVSNDPNANGDSSKLITDWAAKNLTKGTIDTVTSIAALQSYSSTAKYLIVTDTLQGGSFIYKSSGTADNGVVFTATGKGSGYWVRQYDKTKGVSVDWWGNDSYAIIKATNFAGIGGIINFTPNRTYLQYDAIIAQEGQIFNGNGATLKRAPEASNITTLSAVAALTDSIITVTSVPALWKVGDQLQIYEDSTAAGAIQYTRWILAISGNNVSLSAKVGANASSYDQTDAHSAVTSWPIGTKVRKVFSQITTAPVPTSLYDVTPTNFTVTNLFFDGNKYVNGGNHSWYANAAFYARGYHLGILIDNCTFLNMPNDCIEGHGLRVIRNRAYGLSSSFVHLTAISIAGMASQTPSTIQLNFVDGVNELSNSPNTGHAAGAITNSFSSGYVNIQNNRFLNGGESVFGNPETSAGSNNLSVREVNMTGNYFRGFKNISDVNYWGFGEYGFRRIGHIYIDGNVFDSCGVNDWALYRDSLALATDSVIVGQNILFGGTVWKLPTMKSSGVFRYILNNQDTAAQHARILIDSSIGSKYYANTDTSKVLSTDSNGNFYLKSVSAGSGGTVTTFSKTDGYGIISTVTNPTSTPNYSASVDTTVIASKPFLNNYLPKSDSTIANRVTNVENTKADTSSITQTADYVIEKVGSTIYARPGYKSGLPAYSNTDAYTVIQNAINALTPTGGGTGSGGGKILIRSGLYYLTNELTITGWEGALSPYSQLIIQGSGMSTQLIQNTSAKNLLVIKNSASVKLTDMYLYCGASAKSCILGDNTGTYEVSFYKSVFANLYLNASSSSYAAMYLKNPYFSTFGKIQVENNNNSAVIIENTSTTTDYGNCNFEHLVTYASSTSPNGGLIIRSTSSTHRPVLLTFQNYYCFQGYYGIATDYAANCTFNFLSIEQPVLNSIALGKLSGSNETTNFTFNSGYVQPASGGTAIYCSGTSGGNDFNNMLIDGASNTIPINDGWPQVGNKYDITLGYNVNPANINAGSPNTYLSYKQIGVGAYNLKLPTGTTVPSPTTSDSSSAIATTAFVKNQNFSTSGMIEGLQALGSTIKAITLGAPYVGENTYSTALDQNAITYIAVYIPKSQTITGVKIPLRTTGVYNAGTYNGVGLYSLSGSTFTKVASSTNDTAMWKASTGLITKAFTTPYNATPGIYFVAIKFSATSVTTAPKVAAIAPNDLVSLASAFSNGLKITGNAYNDSTLPTTKSSLSDFGYFDPFWVAVY